MKPEKIEELERLRAGFEAAKADYERLGHTASEMHMNAAYTKLTTAMYEAVPELIREVRRVGGQADDAIEQCEEAIKTAKCWKATSDMYQRNAEQAESEAKRLSVALANVSGALVDAGTVDVPEDVTEYGKAVRGVVGERDSLQFVIDTTVKAMKGEELTRFEMGVELAHRVGEVVRERDRVLGRTCDRCKQAAPLSRMVTVYRTGQVPRVRCQACYQVATEAGDWFLERTDDVQ
jgi:hypothetical protein